jgi:hypothetical protein
MPSRRRSSAGKTIWPLVDTFVLIDELAAAVPANKRSWLYIWHVKAAKPGNWTPEGKAERAALRRDYLELTAGHASSRRLSSAER